VDEGRVRTVGVLCVGMMGAGIVQLAAQTGHGVIACDSHVEALKRPNATSARVSHASRTGVNSLKRKRGSTTIASTGR
jgi:3-hydroxyacyl-CoA dehydrogenase